MDQDKNAGGANSFGGNVRPEDIRSDAFPQSAPNIQIPNLKAKDDDKKKPVAGLFGSRASSAFLGSSSSSSGLLGGLLATGLGKGAAIAGILLLAAGAAMFGSSFIKSSAPAKDNVFASDAIASSVRIPGASSARIGVASSGEIKFDENSAAPAPKPEAEEEKTPAPEKAAPEDDRPHLAHDMSGSKLSSGFGSNNGSAGKYGFGGFGAPKFGDVSGKAGLGNFAKAGAGGKTGALSKSARAVASARGLARASSNRAIGQLRMAKGMSSLAAKTSGETAASAANGAFDQQKVDGGGLDVGLHQEVAQIGTGAPDTSLNPDATPPATSPADPNLNNAMNQINSAADQAGQMKKLGLKLLLIGAALVALGMATSWMGLGEALIAAGMAIAAIGGLMLLASLAMASQAKSQGQAVASQVGTYQGNIVNYCTDQALNGTPTSNCHPPDSMTHGSQFDAQSAAGVSTLKSSMNDTPKIQGVNP